MNRKATLAAIVLAATGAAFSAQASDQLATSLGVQPGQYTTAELAQIRDAIEAGDSQRAAFLLSGDARGTESFGSDQLALSLGVEPGAFTAAELVALQSAVEDGDAQAQSFIASGTQRVSRNSADASAPADSQLARLLGVDASDYTSAELGEMYLGAHD